MESGSPAELNSGIPEKVMALFNKVVMKDDEELIDENQLKSAIDDLFYVSFSIRTVRLLMYFVTSKYNLIIGLKDYTEIFLLLKPLNVSQMVMPENFSFNLKGIEMEIVPENINRISSLIPAQDLFSSLKEANGLIEPSKAQQGLASVGTTISDDVFNLLIYNFTDRGSSNAMTFGNFVECRLTIEGLKKKYNDEINKDASNDDFDNFMLTILPYVIS